MTEDIDWSGVVALTFDCYGTLIDWETGLLADLRHGLDGAGACSDAALLAAYARAERAAETPAADGAFVPYREVLRRSLAGVASELGLSVRAADALAVGLPRWPPFPDTVAALRRLGRRFRLCICSNVDLDLFAATGRVLQVEFDAVVTADQVRSYKPHPGHWHEALRRLRLLRSQVVHVAQSLWHDIAPTRHLGIRNVWVDRERAGGATPPLAESPAPDLRVPNLAALADVLHLAQHAS